MAKQTREQRLDEIHFRQKYRNIVANSLTFDERNQKQKVQIYPYGPEGKLDRTRKIWVFTSDLHQKAWECKEDIAPTMRRKILEKNLVGA